MNESMRREIASRAARFGLPERLLAAIVQVESGGDIHAWRVEPHYRYLWDVSRAAPFRRLDSDERRSEIAPYDFPHYGHSSRNTEFWGQQSSWGPMQIMGAVAREHGFRQPFPALCTHAYGVLYGAIHLASLRNRFLQNYGWEGVAAAYNAGSPRRFDDGRWENQGYVDKLIANRAFELERVG